MRILSRRAALMGTAGLLGGCDTISDAAENILGERKAALPGDRRRVLSDDRPIEADRGPAATVTLPAAQDRADWLQAGGGPSHAPGNPTLGAPLAELWRVSIGTGSGYRRRMVAAPVADGRSIFAVDATGEVTAVDAASGRRHWRFDTTPDKESGIALGAGLGLADGVLFCVTAAAEALALDPASGSVKWRVALPAPARGAPTIASGRLLVPTIENQLVALKTADGERLWTYKATPIATMALGLPAPAVEGDTIIAGFASGEVAAISAASGRALWSEALGVARGSSLADIAGVSGLPVLVGGRAYVTAQGSATVALDLRSGRRLWDREVASGETPCVVGDWLFLRSNSQELVCIGRNDGRIRWVRALPRWRNEARRRDPIVWGPPIVAGGRLIIAGNHGEMVELKAADGEPLSRLRLPGPTLLAPLVFGGAMYLLTEEAELVAIRGA